MGYRGEDVSRTPADWGISRLGSRRPARGKATRDRGSTRHRVTATATTTTTPRTARATATSPADGYGGYPQQEAGSSTASTTPTGRRRRTESPAATTSREGTASRPTTATSSRPGRRPGTASARGRKARLRPAGHSGSPSRATACPAAAARAIRRRATATASRTVTGHGTAAAAYPAVPDGGDGYPGRDAGNDWYGGQPAAASRRQLRRHRHVRAERPDHRRVRHRPERGAAQSGSRLPARARPAAGPGQMRAAPSCPRPPGRWSPARRPSRAPARRSSTTTTTPTPVTARAAAPAATRARRATRPAATRPRAATRPASTPPRSATRPAATRPRAATRPATTPRPSATRPAATPAGRNPSGGYPARPQPTGEYPAAGRNPSGATAGGHRRLPAVPRRPARIRPGGYPATGARRTTTPTHPTPTGRTSTTAVGSARRGPGAGYDDYAAVGYDLYQDPYGEDGRPGAARVRAAAARPRTAPPRRAAPGRRAGPRRGGKRPPDAGARARHRFRGRGRRRGRVLPGAQAELEHAEPGCRRAAADRGRPALGSGVRAAVGTYCHIELRTLDPTPLTLAELYPPVVNNEADGTGTSPARSPWRPTSWTRRARAR